MNDKETKEILLENQQLREHTRELEDTLDAIRNGEVDALIVSGSEGDQIYTLKGALDAYRVIVEAMSDGAVTLSRDSSIFYCNDYFAEMVGIPRDQIIGMPFADMVTEQERNRFDKMMAQSIKGEVRGELMLLSADKKPVPVYLSMHPMAEDEGKGIAVVVTDLAEMAAAAEAQSLLSLIVESSDDAIISTTLEGVVQSWNRAAEKLFGYSRAETVGQSLDTLILPSDHDDEQARGFEAIQQGKSIKNLETVRQHKDGTPIDVSIVASPILDAKGMIVGLSINIRDISERLLSAKKIHDSEENFRTIFETAKDIIFILGPEGHFINVSPSLEAITGFPPSEFIGEPFARFVHADDLTRTQEIFRQVLAGKNFDNIEIRVLKKSGDYFPCEISVDARKYENAVQVIGIARDITPRKLAEEALQRSEKEFRTLTESMPQIVWISSPDGGNIYLNQQWSDYTGLTLEESLANGWNKPFHPDDLQNALHAWQNARKNNSTYSIESRLRRADGIYRWWLIRGIPLHDDDGNILKWFGTCTDIHDMKVAELEIARTNMELRESERRFSDILENVELVAIMLDREGRITYSNEYLLQLSGWQREEIIGEDWFELFLPPELHYLKDQFFTGLLSGLSEMRHRKNDILTRTGERRLIQWNNTVLRSAAGEVTGAASIGEDITEYMHAQQAINKLNEELEDKVLKRTAELERARTEADHASQAKSDFLAAMSHEIRTPMNGVIGMIDVLQQSDLNAAQLKMSKIIHNSAYALLDVINDILDFSKIEAGKIIIDNAPMVLSETIAGVGEMLTGTAANKNISLQVFVDPALPDQIIGDAGRLRQILINLTGNAIKFSSGQTQAGKVSLRARLLDISEQKVSVEFNIRDNGIGMDKATQERLFTPFTQANKSIAAKFGGTGLGLVITQQLVQLMKGELVINSKPGEGTSIQIGIAFKRVPQDADTIKSSPLAEMRCLLVGVEEDIADDLFACLAHAGARIEQVDDVDAARRWLNNCQTGQCVAFLYDQAVNESALADLRATIDSLPDLKVGLVMSGRGKLLDYRAESDDLVKLDTEIIHRDKLIRTVDLALGRISPETEAPSPLRSSKQAAPPSRETAIEQGRLILVAEDNKINQQVILQQLHLFARTADVANNGREALKMWESGQYSALLTDLSMPEMDGYELCAAIRAAENNESHLPIIALTANALKSEAEHCLKAGMDDYLSKPVQLEALAEVLDKWLPLADDDETPVEPVRQQTNAEHTLSVAVDMNVLKTLFGDKVKIIHKVLHDFPAHSSEIANDLRAAYHAGQANDVGSLGHKLKSSSRTVGALKLGDICESIEKAGKAEDMATLELLLPRLEQELTAVEQYLKEYFAESQAG